MSDFKLTSGSTTRSTTFSSDPFDCLDDFAAPVKSVSNVSSNIRNVKPLIQPKPSVGGGASSFYTCTSSIVPLPTTTSFDDTLNNGKNLIKPSSISMPTIIKPTTSSVKGKVSPNSVASQDLFSSMKTAPSLLSHQSSDESFDDDLPSLPMPSIPPPPPPLLEDGDNEELQPHAIALYDFESDVVEDLNLRVSSNKCPLSSAFYNSQINRQTRKFT